MNIRILIADDHSVVRQGLKMFLALDPELEVVGEAANGAEALRLAQQLNPDVVLMDLLMPVMDGIEATAVIRRELPDTEVIALTSVLEDQAIFNAMRAGAMGYLLKDTEANKLFDAEADLVVLATGMVSNLGDAALPFEVSMDADGFGLDDSQNRIFMAGVARRPEDVAASVRDATGAAAKALSAAGRSA